MKPRENIKVLYAAPSCSRRLIVCMHVSKLCSATMYHFVRMLLPPATRVRRCLLVFIRVCAHTHNFLIILLWPVL